MNNTILRLDEKLVDDFCNLRIELLEELGEIRNDTNISQLKFVTKKYYLSHINKDLISWGILCNKNIVAIGSLCLFTRIPYEENLSGLEGYILNIYTCPQFRKYGFANLILDEIIKYASETNIKRLWLNSSENGEKLYCKKGFIKKENEMELLL